MSKTSLSDVSRKSAVQILTELAASFSSKSEYIRYLEGVAMLAFKDALVLVEEQGLGVSPGNRAEYAYGRAAAFLMIQELEIQRRLNQVVCGREIEE